MEQGRDCIALITLLPSACSPFAPNSPTTPHYRLVHRIARVVPRLYKRVLCRTCLQRSRLFYFYLRPPTLLYSRSSLVVRLTTLFGFFVVSPTCFFRGSRIFPSRALLCAYMNASERACICVVSFFSSFLLYRTGNEIYNTVLFPSSYKDRSVKVNDPRYPRYPPVYDYTDNGLIMLYLHYGKQFVKTVLSAPPSVDAGQEAQLRGIRSCYTCIAIHRSSGGLRRSRYFENS